MDTEEIDGEEIDGKEIDRISISSNSDEDLFDHFGPSDGLFEGEEETDQPSASYVICARGLGHGFVRCRGDVEWCGMCLEWCGVCGVVWSGVGCVECVECCGVCGVVWGVWSGVEYEEWCGVYGGMCGVV